MQWAGTKYNYYVDSFTLSKVVSENAFLLLRKKICFFFKIFDVDI